MTDPQTDPVGFDDDEDLFAFDNLTAEASRKLSAELEAELDNALEEIEGDFDLAQGSSPTQGAEGVAAPALPTAASAPATPAAAPASPESAPSPLSARVPELGALPPLPQRSSSRRSYLTLHRTQLLLGLMVVINFLLAGLSWRAEDTERQMPVIADAQGVFAPLGNEGRQTRVTSNRDLPISEPRAEGYETLEEAARSIEDGEFHAAREMLFALLSVIDRVDDTARYDVEARASYMIADTYRFEAEALALSKHSSTQVGERQ